VSFLDGAGGLPLGVFEPYEITSETLTLHPNDTIVLYTDGITEAMNTAREMFGAGAAGCGTYEVQRGAGLRGGLGP
jgi:sigma-B regulation protein RsbU (phosphoserine phosphatase)